jgi:eukaryotic-like serine/threonine-protein kinase
MDAESRDELWKVFLESESFSKPQLRAARTILTEESDDVVIADKLQEAGLLTNYQAKKVKIGRLSEILFGIYFIQEKLGEGGMGKVYKALQRGVKRTVALKVVRPHLMSNKTVLKRYQREAAAVAKLDHPNIVTLYDVADVNGRYYLSMEYVDGIDLSRMVKEFGKPPEKGLPQYQEACEYIRQSALGLAHAHQRDLVHRDIKPSNILVHGERALPGTSGQAKIKVLDMGLVRSLSDDDDVSRTELTRDGTVVGTPDYMAPEQAKNSSTVDGRADIYSLGCTLFFLLAGRVLYPDGSPIEKLLKHQVDAPPDISRLRPDLPRELVRVWLRMIEKDREKRFQNCTEVAKALYPFTPLGELEHETTVHSAFSLAPELPMSDIGMVVNSAVPVSEPKVVDSPPPVSRSSPVQGTRTSNTVPQTTRKLPPTPLQKQVKPVTARTVVPGAMAVPRNDTAPSSESLPSTPAAKGNRSTRTEDETPATVERRRERRAAKPTRSPLMIPLIVGGSIGAMMLLVVLGLFIFGSRPTTPTSSSPATTEPKQVSPPTITSQPVANLELMDLIPDQTYAVLVLHPKNYLSRDVYSQDKKASPKALKYVKLLNQKMQFNPPQCSRITIPFVTAKNQWAVIGEGRFVTSEWEQEFIGIKGMQRSQLAGQKAFHSLSWTKGANYGVLLGSAYAISPDQKLLNSMADRVAAKRPSTAIPPSLRTMIGRISTVNDADLVFAASDQYVLPDGETLKKQGVEWMLAKVNLVDDEFRFHVTFSGGNEPKLKAFLNEYLTSTTLPEKYPSTKPMITSILRGSDSSVKVQPTGIELHLDGKLTWAQFHDGIERILPEPDMKD